MEKDIRTSLMLDRKLYAKVQKIAKEERLTPSAWIEKLIAQNLREAKAA